MEKKSLISLFFLWMMGNGCSYLLKYVQQYMEIQHRRQKESLYNSNEPKRQYLV